MTIPPYTYSPPRARSRARRLLRFIADELTILALFLGALLAVYGLSTAIYPLKHLTRIYGQ